MGALRPGGVGDIGRRVQLTLATAQDATKPVKFRLISAEIRDSWHIVPKIIILNFGDQILENHRIDVFRLKVGVHTTVVGQLAEDILIDRNVAIAIMVCLQMTEPCGNNRASHAELGTGFGPRQISLIPASLLSISKPSDLSPLSPTIRSTFITRDDVRGGHLLFHRPGPRSGESLSQTAARNKRGRVRRHHRTVRRDPYAQPRSLTPTMSEIYARDHQMAASPTLRQSGGPDPDDVFEPTTAQRTRRRLLVRDIGQTEQRAQWIHVAGRTLVRRCRQDQDRHFAEALAKLPPDDPSHIFH
ncbi:hypothetical protein E4U61_001231 [Claviceps capensis]|nr:hypothetical protein E4U61_001231 [Claviceps capensis]